jgi:L-ascorbate metabolism protein UlaG (beta-lactamase superfamily)
VPPNPAWLRISPGGRSIWQDAALEVRWIAHSWFQLTAGDVSVQIDPSSLGSKGLEALAKGARKADLVLVTHHHADHCRGEIVGMVSKEGAPVLAPGACAGKLGDRATLVRTGDSYSHRGISVRAVDAYNTPEGSSTIKAHKKGECLGYLVTLNGKTVYHAGDTDLIPEMGSLGHIDVALIPIGGTYTMDTREAVEAARRMEPGVAVPMHCLDADPEDFARKMGKKARVAILRPGEALSLA